MGSCVQNVHIHGDNYNINNYIDNIIMIKFIDSLVGPMSKDWCSYYYYSALMSLFFALIVIVKSVLSLILPSIKYNSNDPIFILQFLIMYILYRLMYNMCINSLK